MFLKVKIVVFFFGLWFLIVCLKIFLLVLDVFFDLREFFR